MEKTVNIVGAGASGLFAAYHLLAAGFKVNLFDQMSAVGKKFLVAGYGGLNITHSEDLDQYVLKYGDNSDRFADYLEAFSPERLRLWCEELGVETFVGSSGRVFPKHMKAATMLKSWVSKLKSYDGFELFLNHKLVNIDNKELTFEFVEEEFKFPKEQTILGLGGASWSKTGSDGKWVSILKGLGIELAPFAPMNSGFNVEWSEHFKEKFEIAPLKNITLNLDDHIERSDIMLTQYGIEGSGVYTLGLHIRKKIEAEGSCTVLLDLKPDLELSEIKKRLTDKPNKVSLSNYLRKKLKLDGIDYSLLKECSSKEQFQDLEQLANLIKNLPIKCDSPTSLEESISVAGGVMFNNLDENLMLKKYPGIYVTGEMLDWEAQTGGYLLQGCFSTAFVAVQAIINI